MPTPATLVSPLDIRDHDLRVIQGEVPAGLHGEIFYATPGPNGRGAHAFFSDGVALRLSLRPDTFGASAGTHALRMKELATPSSRLRKLRPEAFRPTVAGSMGELGHVNAANTAPLPWGDRMFFTWDAGRPVEVDPVSLEFLGELGHKDAWAAAMPFPVLPMIMSSAHPVIDAERDCLWTLHYPLMSAPTIVRIDADSTQLQQWPLEGPPVLQSAHTLAQTRDWLVIADTAFRVDPHELMGQERELTVEPDATLWIVRKADLESASPGQPVKCTVGRLPASTMHFWPVYDDAPNAIRILFEHMDGMDVAVAMRPGDRDLLGREARPELHGLFAQGLTPGSVSEVTIDPTSGRITDRVRLREATMWNPELSADDWSLAGMSRPTLHHQLFTGHRPDAIPRRLVDLWGERIDAASIPTEPVPARLLSIARGSMKIAAEHVFGDDDFPTSPSFVQREGGEAGGHDGWVVLPVLNDAGARFEVFDAARVEDGPVATLGMDRPLPLLLHSAWVPAVAPARDVERVRFGDELDPEVVATLPAELQAAVRQVADELG